MWFCKCGFQYKSKDLKRSIKNHLKTPLHKHNLFFNRIKVKGGYKCECGSIVKHRYNFKEHLFSGVHLDFILEKELEGLRLNIKT